MSEACGSGQEAGDEAGDHSRGPEKQLCIITILVINCPIWVLMLWLPL